MVNIITVSKGVDYLKQGKIIAYPTEAVYGFGCDPDNQKALHDLLSLKKRDQSKGLILIASSLKQLDFYIDLSKLSEDTKIKIKQTWPGFVTWLIPINLKNITKISPVLYGKFDTIAVRVTNHPVVVHLCNTYMKPIVSTSANVSGGNEIKDIETFSKFLTNSAALDLVLGIVMGDIGKYDKPSKIVDARSGKILRK